MLVAGGTDLLPNMKRRQQVPATLVGLAADRGAETRSRTGMGLTIGAGVTLTACVDDPRVRGSLRGPVAGGRAGRDAASAQHGHDRRQPLPRHALQLLRPELRVAQGDRLLHEEGRRHVLGRDVESEVPGGVVHRHRAGADGARRERHARQRRRHAQRCPSPICSRTTASTT